ncbi:MAG: isoleucine--tRNA ligase [Clostridiales bacterium]|nr:isoleucine--tRNA ligase [Clostridiales bacterium]
MYKKAEPDLNAVEREKEIAAFWKENDVFEKTLESTEKGKEFSFYDGPPTANGKPHIGHILTRVMKDIIPRYKTMKGYHVRRKAGWDTHGLPVELEVEKQLGFDGKQDIEKYGIEPFIGKCKNSVFTYKSEWEKMSERVGYWVDMDNPYVTYDDKYIESVWWALKEIDKQGLIYHGHKIVPYCPRCGTALSSHEVAQGYKDVTEKTCIVRFAVPSRERTYILAWTTTPWTLPSNVALCMNADYDYATVLCDGDRYIMAAALVPSVFEGKQYEIERTDKGSAFKGLRYEPLFPFYEKKEQDCHYVVCDGYVTLSDGTGVVHIAPAFGEDDARVGRANDLPFVKMIDDRGRFIEQAKPYVGLFCKDADKTILRDLKAQGKLFKELSTTHSYPHCWRCDTPLLYYAKETWFIRMTAVRDRLIKNNASVHWFPESIGTGRMGNFLENVIDWGLSRDRYWGTPLPIWVCDKCGKTHVVGSKEELKKLGGIKGDIELHKPYVDGVTFACDCGGKMHRTPEVIDCWFDSGSMPFAQYHYPFENKDIFEKTFPADFISEAVDQTRGWFYTLLAISTLLFDRAPFKNCIVLGHVCDKDGFKMSKHKGNVVDPYSVLDKQGADAVRWHFYTSSAPYLPSRFYPEAVSEVQRKFLGTLWNTYCFYVLYADIDGFDPTKYDLKKCTLSVMDKWILSALNTLVKTVDDDLNEYKITEAARAISDFTDELSNWYVRRCRDRYWGSDMASDKIAAYMTLYTVLETLARLLAPFTPFIAEEIYQNIVRSVDSKAPISVHLCAYPKCNAKYVDKKLESDMEVAKEAAALGRAARSASSIKKSQTLIRHLLAGQRDEAFGEDIKAVIADELNVKRVEIVDTAASYISYSCKPQLRTIGPKYGKLLGGIREHLATHGEEAVKGTADGKTYTFTVDGAEVALTADDLLSSVTSKEGYAAQSGTLVTCVLDTTLTPELIEEGYYRELVSKLQTARKDAGFNVTDHIAVTLGGDEEVLSAAKNHHDELCRAVLCDTLTFGGGATEIDVNGKKATISVQKI